ncbi:WD repeat and HMG-box DNA-binding protein 1 isoform X2 [Orussus abietinus]|uniref:WD repeat and HMG-box DNA-binding protein 1 isoform X2 n=1 Tax=Orussus abietinus TaxID=222816 RepID=UPI0006256EE8|nr:WD repeat and HMG-box DNA-binding protein 1 isoform X2 [Orussus abietinus]
MPLINKLVRFAHQEGHTDVCYYNGEKGGLISCGLDGDVRTWFHVTDDDPGSTCISEQATAVISKDGKIYVGTDNTVQILTYPDLEKQGIITRFSASVSALTSAKNSKLIVSAACDMRIRVTNIEKSDTIELNGHEAPVLGISLDPKEVFLASSSADGTIRVWDIKEKKAIHIWNNVVPKCNSFFMAKTYSTPSFHSVDGSVLAYPHEKDVVVTERSTWKELFRLKCSNLRGDLSISKFSECATRLAASSVFGEIVVWNFNTQALLGYIEHDNNTKITAIAWNLKKPDEIAFTDKSGQLGCLTIVDNSELVDELLPVPVPNEKAPSYELDDDDDGENVISLNKIKSSVEDGDTRSDFDAATEDPQKEIKSLAIDINLQQPFQPGSSPVHLLSRYMVWNEVGIVKCFASEDGEESSIEVEFHDSAVHHAIHINNYLQHTLAALSTQALALSCSANDGQPSKLVVVVLQGWGSGNKEWSIDLPEGEHSSCLAAGNNFVAVATTRRFLRLYMIGGTQREIIGLPGQVVAMNAHGNHLVVAYHTGLGSTLRSQTLSVPLSPSTELMWLGLSDLGSPTIMDAEGVLKIYDRKSCLWRVACDMDRQSKGKLDHFFIIGVSEAERTVHCILCKGSHYPPTVPRPTVSEISLVIPLCEPETEKSTKEAILWQLGSDPLDEKETVLSLIALACRSNVEYRAVELCQEVATQKVIELAVKYAGRINRMALANKLESIFDSKNQSEEDEIEPAENKDDGFAVCDEIEEVENTPELILTPTTKKHTVEIKPLTPTVRRNNPFLKTGSAPRNKSLSELDALLEQPQKTKSPVVVPSKPKPKKSPRKESFVSWYAKNKKSLQEEFPELSSADLTKAALKRFKEEGPSKKRKLSNGANEEDSQAKRPSINKLTDFICRDSDS